MSYRIYTDGIFGGIQHSSREPNDHDVFRTFGGAKRALIRRMRSYAEQYLRSARDFRSYTAKDVEPEEPT